jgi:hypothetical protein
MRVIVVGVRRQKEELEMPDTEILSLCLLVYI